MGLVPLQNGTWIQTISWQIDELKGIVISGGTDINLQLDELNNQIGALVSGQTSGNTELNNIKLELEYLNECCEAQKGNPCIVIINPNLKPTTPNRGVCANVPLKTYKIPKDNDLRLALLKCSCYAKGAPNSKHSACVKEAYAAYDAKQAESLRVEEPTPTPTPSRGMCIIHNPNNNNFIIRTR